MNKRLIDEYNEFLYKGEKTPFSLGTLAVVVFCCVLLIVATFTKIDISHYWFDIQNQTLSMAVKKFQLVPQIPALFFLTALLGVRYSILVMILYILTGFFLYPVFAFGGGLGYVKSYFFGYILGFFAAIIFVGKILDAKFSIKNLFFASIIGVLSIHLCGIFYSFILSFFNSTSYTPNFKLVFVQIIYDIIFSMLAIIIAKPVKYILWIAMKNEPGRKKEKN